MMELEGKHYKKTLLIFNVLICYKQKYHQVVLKTQTQSKTEQHIII